MLCVFDLDNLVILHLQLINNEKVPRNSFGTFLICDFGLERFCYSLCNLGPHCDCPIFNSVFDNVLHQRLPIILAGFKSLIFNYLLSLYLNLYLLG